MEGLLTAVKTTTGDSNSFLSPATEDSAHSSSSEPELQIDATSLDHILAVLKSKPDDIHLSYVLAALDPAKKKSAPKTFDIRVPSPNTAQVLNVLVSITIPDHWESIQGPRNGNSKLRGMLLRCFSSVPGLSCLVTQLRSLIMGSRSGSQKAKGSSDSIRFREILSIISALLEPKDFILRLYADINVLYSNETQKQLAWREVITLLAASKVLLTAAEALMLIKDVDDINKSSWLGEGTHYASWLGANICHMVMKPDLNNQAWSKAVASLTGRALSIGYTG